MAWDKTKPAATTSLRLSNPELLANFVAIEEGTVPFDALKLEANSAPSAVASFGFLYAKDVSAKAELHYLDEDSNEVQLTSAGSIGVSTQALACSTLTATTVNGTTFDTNVAAAGVTLTATTLAADGTDDNIDITITPKGTGSVVQSKVDINGGSIDGTIIGAVSAAAGTFSALTASTSLTAAGLAYPTSDGSANQVMKTDGAGTLSFTTISSTYVELSTADISSDASVIFDNTYITDTYKVYMLLFSDVKPASDDVQLKLEVSNDNGSSYRTSGYESSVGIMDAGGIGNRTYTNSMTISDDGGNRPMDSSDGLFGTVRVYNPTNASNKTSYEGNVYYTTDTNVQIKLVMGGRYDTAEDNDAIRIIFSSGNLASGKITLYGIVES